MRRRLNIAPGGVGRFRALALMGLTCAACAVVLGQADPVSAQAPGADAPASGIDREKPSGSTAADESQPNGSARELGVHLGLTSGGRVTAGGLRIGGSYLYQLSAVDWFEGSIDFVIGGTSADCFTDRTGELLCNHGALSGRSGEISAGIRRFLTPQGSFTPYARVRLGLRAVSFSGDDLRGLAAVVIAGIGVRARVHELVSIGGGAIVDAGAGIFGRDLGTEPQFSLAIQGGVEFLLK
ncbi:MAG: hypothetical protein MJE77_20940 [Proteobacteria bacterium]|nr:hypothetical protein [Pseudomonadota bacterium]